MTAGKNQAQPIILKGVVFMGPFRRTRLRFEIAHELVLRRIKSCPATQSINGFESGRRNQPWSRVAGYSTLRPQAQRRGEGFVHRLLGKIKITEQADQSCQDSSRIHAIKGVEQFAYLLGGTLGHDDDVSKPATPNQFSKRRIDAKCQVVTHPGHRKGSDQYAPEAYRIDQELSASFGRRIQDDGPTTLEFSESVPKSAISLSRNVAYFCWMESTYLERL